MRLKAEHPKNGLASTSLVKHRRMARSHNGQAPHLGMRRDRGCGCRRFCEEGFVRKVRRLRAQDAAGATDERERDSCRATALQRECFGPCARASRTSSDPAASPSTSVPTDAAVTSQYAVKAHQARSSLLFHSLAQSAQSSAMR